MTIKFKLIIGMGLFDLEKISKLALAYATAGADIIDSSPVVMPFIQKTLQDAGYSLNSFDFCVSIPVKGDIHAKKAEIISSKCNLCKICTQVCAEGAICPPLVEKNLCIGCQKCKNACPRGAIQIYDNKNLGFEDFLNSNSKLDTVEFHIGVNDKALIIREFKKLIQKLNNKNCKISVCLGRKFFSNNDTKEILYQLKNISSSKKFLVQADGNSMNGGENSISSTIEAVSFGLFCKNLGYNVIISGGTNEYTKKLAQDCGFEPIIAYGSYARKILSGLDDKKAAEAALNFVKRVKT